MRIARWSAVFAVFCLSGLLAQTKPAHTIRVEQRQFVLDGRPLQIISGEMHYARIPRAYWRDRMKKARAMGLNAISTYVFWNLHEPAPGKWDFNGQNDVAEFVREAQQEGLYVILRPGPYVCSEWDLGGLPAWLLADPGMVLRSADEKFLGSAERYLQRLGQELAPLQITRGGPIIAVQVENEYGSFDKDKIYMGRVRDAIRKAGFGEVVLYTADGPAQLPDGTLPDLSAAVNFGPGYAERGVGALRKFRPDGPTLVGEYWAGWFDHWGRKHHTTDAEQESRELDWMLTQGASVNLYMFHGGTTFGFMNGANWDRGYWPDTTSYDYDAAVDEAGRPTKKFALFRDVIAKHRPGEQFPELPAPTKIIEVPEIKLTEAASLWSTLPKPAKPLTAAPLLMEREGQSYGYIAYGDSFVEGPRKGELVLSDLHDYAQVYADGQLAGTVDRRLQQDRLFLTVTSQASLHILVENSGRINFGPHLRDDRKGIRKITFAGEELKGWGNVSIPMTALPSRGLFKSGLTVRGPAFYRGTFRLSEIGDTFLDLRGMGKGTVWVNGQHLGRFWNIGPQQTLYVPAPWLKKGTNEVIVFTLAENPPRTIRALREPVLDELRP